MRNIYLFPGIMLLAGGLSLYQWQALHRGEQVTEERYASIVKPGIKVEELQNAFGSPEFKEQTSDGATMMEYPAPSPKINDGNQTNVFGGFSVLVRDGVVVKSQVNKRTVYKVP